MATPNLALFPSGRKATKLYSVLPTDGTGDFTVSRASKKNEINSDLKLEIIDNNVPAFNYDSVGGCPVLNTEPQATNLITYPISFDNIYWTKSGATIDDNGGAGYSAPSVDFPTSAFKLVPSITSGVHWIQPSPQAITVGVETTYSIYVKTGDFPYLMIGDARLSTGSNTVQFNIETGELVYSASVGAGWSISDTGFTELGNGYKRFWAVFISGNAQQEPVFGVEETIRTGTQYCSTYTWTPTIVGGNNIFMAQLEQGSYATSPTFTDTTLGDEGSTTTRLADVVTGAGDVNTFNSSEGVLYAEISVDNDNTFNYISLSDGGASNYASIGITDSDDEIFCRYYVGGSGVNITVSISDVEVFNKIAFKYKVNDFAIWVNGVEVATDLSGGVNSADTFDQLSFARGTSNTPFYGDTKQLQVYNTALSDAELLTLTTL